MEQLAADGVGAALLSWSENTKQRLRRPIILVLERLQLSARNGIQRLGFGSFGETASSDALIGCF
ncbi:uncharacterized protein Dsimw501_GD28331 [Drosophila simulans]|uniref:Uncharacterized protein n=1 Tax=Drosophila simulans TaxID=7240 RepID=A0A0J9TSH1_DROSI|nr:uncharacterized protein Dsimw501_GD28331 [Drosophila simulans]